MDPVTMATAIANLILIGQQIYTQIQQSEAAKTNGAAIPSLNDALAAADANFKQLAANAQAEIQS